MAVVALHNIVFCFFQQGICTVLCSIILKTKLMLIIVSFGISSITIVSDVSGYKTMHWKMYSSPCFQAEMLCFQQSHIRLFFGEVPPAAANAADS